MLQDPQSKLSQQVNQPRPVTQEQAEAQSQPQDLGNPNPTIQGTPDAGIAQPPSEVKGENRVGFLEAQKQAIQNGAKEKLEAKLKEQMAPKNDGPSRKGPETPGQKPNLGSSGPEPKRPEPQRPQPGPLTPKVPSIQMPKFGKPRF